MDNWNKGMKHVAWSFWTQFELENFGMIKNHEWAECMWVYEDNKSLSKHWQTQKTLISCLDNMLFQNCHHSSFWLIPYKFYQWFLVCWRMALSKSWPTSPIIKMADDGNIQQSCFVSFFVLWKSWRKKSSYRFRQIGIKHLPGTAWIKGIVLPPDFVLTV